MRVGFPKLRKEWEAELPDAELPEEASSSEEDRLGREKSPEEILATQKRPSEAGPKAWARRCGGVGAE